MQRKKVIQIEIEEGEKKDVTIYEVRPKEVYNIFFDSDKGSNLTTELKDFLPKCTSLTLDELADLYPSDMEVVIKEFKEVNASFLAPWPSLKKIIQRLGVTEWLINMLEKSGMKDKISKVITNDWSKLAAGLQKEDI